MSGQQHAPAALYPPGKTRYPFYRRLGGPQGWSGRVENLVPTRIRSRTVQPVVSCYTDWATRPTSWRRWVNQSMWTLSFTHKKDKTFLPVWMLIRKCAVLAATLGILSTPNIAAENSKHTPTSVVYSTLLGLRSWSHHFMNQGVCWMHVLNVLVPLEQSQQIRPYILQQDWELKVSKLPPMAGGYYPGLTVTHT